MMHSAVLAMTDYVCLTVTDR